MHSQELRRLPDRFDGPGIADGDPGGRCTVARPGCPHRPLHRSVDSPSALTFANLLRGDLRRGGFVGVIVSPATDLTAVATYVEAERAGNTGRPTYAGVHGRDATEVRAADLTLDRFIDAATLAAAPSLPAPRAEIRTVLLYLAQPDSRPVPAVGLAGTDGAGRRR